MPQTVRPHGYHVVISCFEEDPELEASEADSLLARRVDGLIIASSQSPQCPDLFERIEEQKVPYVLIDRPIAGLQACYVGVDNYAIGTLATEHLIARGCRRIAHLRGPEVGIAAERLAGYRRALVKHGIRPNSHYVVSGGHRDDTGYEGMRKLLDKNPFPDGIFCYNDPVAIGAMRAILEVEFNLPDDICVVGAGNIHYSDQVAVPLTTVDQGTCRIGALAAELLIERIASKRPMPAKRILIPPKLVERESTRRKA